ncbi:hypothetical protein F443_02466, partial [Phytophthora nicotianae P1569]
DTVAIEPAPTQASTVADASEQDSDEPDDSNDEDWSDADEASEEDEVLTGENEAEEEAVEEAEDTSINLIEVDVHQLVTDFIRDDACERRCLEGKAGELEHLVRSLEQMTKAEKTTCILTLIGVLMQTDTAERRRGTGEREKFRYYLPFVGHVCRPSFARCLGVQPLTAPRYKRRVRDGCLAAAAHGNKANKNASKVDLVWLVKWFEAFAAEVGEVVPVRVRMQKTQDGKVKKILQSRRLHASACDLYLGYRLRRDAQVRGARTSRIRTSTLHLSQTTVDSLPDDPDPVEAVKRM